MEYGKYYTEKVEKMYQELAFCYSENNQKYSQRKRNYNSKVYDIINNYIQVCEHYFPSDYKTYDCYTDEELSMSYWYVYYMETIVYRILSAVDLLYHVINEEYKLQVETKVGFQHKIRNEMKGSDLVDELKRVHDSNKELSKLRNKMMHNVDIAELKVEIKNNMLRHYFEYSNNQSWKLITNGLENLKSLKDKIELALEKEGGWDKT